MNGPLKDTASLDHALQQLEACGGAVNRTASPGSIVPAQIEADLGLELPPSLKAFYTKYEYLQIGPYEFTWVKLLPESTRRLRARGMAPPFLPVLEDGMGGHFVVLCAEWQKEKPEGFGAVFHDLGIPGRNPEFCCQDFLQFVQNRIELVMDEIGD